MPTLSVLLIEDEEDHAVLISRCLSEKTDHELAVDIRHVTTMSAAQRAMQEVCFDVVVSDLNLPDSTVDDTLSRVLQTCGDSPVVVLTSVDDSRLGTELVKQGAQDFLVKTTITRPLITRSVLYAVERRRHELEQKAHAEQLESLVDARTRHLQLLRSVADVSHEAHSIREALQRTVDYVCDYLRMPLGVAFLLPEPQASSAQDIGVFCQQDHSDDQLMPGEGESDELLQQAIDDQHVVTSDRQDVFEVVLPIVSGCNVPAVLRFRSLERPDDVESVVGVLERIRTQIGRVFERDHLQRAIEESAHMEQQLLIGELHDGLGHELSGLTWLAQSHMLNLKESQSEAAQTAADLHSGLLRSLTILRSALRGLTSLQLGAGGFVPALSSLIAEANRRSDCRIELDCRLTVLPINEFTASQIYRIVQESLTNVTKHAQATEACVTVLLRDKQLTVSIADNGRGLATGRNVDSGLGFGIMRHRARLIGGELTIREAPAGGLQLVLTVPYNPEPSAAESH